MAQSARNSKLETRTARLKLAKGERFHMRIGERLALIYRRTDAGYGTWSAKMWTERAPKSGKAGYMLVRLGAADDFEDADGAGVLSFYQAQENAKALAHADKLGTGTLRTGPLTVRQAVKRYIDNLRAHKGDNAAQDAQYRLDKHVLRQDIKGKPLDKPGVTNLADVEVQKLTLTQLQKWLNGMVQRDKNDSDLERRSKDSANRTLATFKAALNHAFEDSALGLASDKAWRALKAFKSVGAARADHFTEAEVLSLIDAARTQDGAFANLLEAQFHTGARPGRELSAIDARHVDLKRAQITIPEGKTGPRVTTLTDEGVAFFKRLIDGKRPRDILLPTADGLRWGKSQQHRPMKAALKAAELPLSASQYTLRHTVISRSIERGMPLTLIAENVGTSLRMIEMNYGKFIAQTRRQLIQQMAPILRVIEGGKAQQEPAARRRVAKRAAR